MPAGAKYCIIFGAFHVSSHAVLTCQLIVKEQNFNRIYVKIQWAFVGSACSGLHFTCREGNWEILWQDEQRVWSYREKKLKEADLGQMSGQGSESYVLSVV